jgi:N-acetyl-1-D-myo-inositol-2-amino-2-deoxy-alpha-D-glucopyranoside deacetylase
MTSRRTATLLALLAHPDDEIFHGGMLAHLSERGVRVTVVSATAGDAGKVHPSLGAVSDLAATRTAELRASCAELGLEEPILLGYHDSARKDRFRADDPRALSNVDMLEVEAAIVALIERLRPQVLFTFEPHGGYYHPDHMAVHRATAAAFFSSGRLEENAPERLFYGAMTTETFLDLAEQTRGRGIIDGLDPDVFSVRPNTVAVFFDARPYLRRKLLALAAHRSAFGVTPEMLENPPMPQAGLLRSLRSPMEHEGYMVGGLRGPLPRWPLRDLFDGLEADGLRPA